MSPFQINKERKIILTAGVILLLFGVLFRFWPTMISFGSGTDEIEMKAKTIAKYQARISKKKVLDKNRLVLAKNLENMRQGLLRGQTPALAAVSMQNRLNEIASHLDVNIRSMRVLKSDPVENANLILVRVQMIIAELTVSQLKKLLYKIESSDSLLHIRNLQLRKRSEKLPIQLQTSLTVEGFMSKPNSDE